MKVVRYYAAPFVLKPFSRISLERAASILGYPIESIEGVLSDMINESHIKARINQVERVLESDDGEHDDADFNDNGPSSARLKLLQRWAACNEVLGKMAVSNGVFRRI